MKKPRLCLALLTALVVVTAARPAAPARPNVLFIMVDDLNDWVGFLHGHPQARTPNMDRIAARGMIFAAAECAAPVCCPSRAALFSGLEPYHSGFYNNRQNVRRERPDLELMPQTFAAAGYRTLGTGKLLHTNSKEMFETYFQAQQRWSPFPNARAVDYPADRLSERPADPSYPVRLGDAKITLPLNRMPSERNATTRTGESFDWGAFDVDDEQMGDAKITTWAIEQFSQPSDKPLFLAVGYYRPHLPLYAPKRYFDMFPPKTTVLPKVLEGDLEDLSATGRHWALDSVTAGSHQIVIAHGQWHAAVAAYLSCIAFVDAQIGRLLDALDHSPQADNTVIVLLGDHGWHLGEKNHWGKWTGWERATSTPLVIVPPRHTAMPFKTGVVCTQPVGLIDLYPTLLDMCGLSPRPELDGESLVLSLKDPERPTEPEITTFDPGNFSITDGRWRFIRYADGSEELYDHASDPNEWDNLSGDARYAEIRQALAAHLPAESVKPVPVGDNTDGD